jgi:hypothetical protein
MSFSSLKKNRNNFEKLTKKLESTSFSGNSDDRFWYPERDKSGRGTAMIRFLPAPNGEDIPWVKVYSHGFKDNGGGYIENCPTTNGGECPVCKANSELWNSGLEANKDIARSRKRRLTYISNVLVLKDPANPENEGKVFLFKYGMKIHEKITQLLQPEFEDQTPSNPFDFWEGSNFNLRISKVAGFVNYDKSSFDAQSPVFDDDKEMEKVWKLEHALEPFVAASEFKAYDELETRMKKVLGSSATSVGSVTESAPADVPTVAEGEETAAKETEDFFKTLDID